MSDDALAAPRFGAGPPLALGLEDELLLVDGERHALADTAVAILDALDVPEAEGTAKPDMYAAMVELTAPVSASAEAATRAVAALRARVRDAGGTVIGAGVHPAAAHGDVRHFPAERYAAILARHRGLMRRTPTGAVHVHVAMPDAETAIRACNGLRDHLPALGALAANSPFWFGVDSGMQSARSALFRGLRGAEIPRAFASYEDYAETATAAVAAGDLEDYTFLWWDLRPHPRLGTVEVRAMDGQSALWGVAGLTALIRALAAREADPATWRTRAAPRRARRSSRRASPPTATASTRACRSTERCAPRARWCARPSTSRARTRATSATPARSRRSSGSRPRATAPTASARRTRAAAWRRCSGCWSRRAAAPYA